jgi:hypothetical protein
MYYYAGDQLNIAKDLLDASLLLYPNPTRNILAIDAKNSQFFKVEIYAITGKKVLFTNNTNNMNVNALPSGIYTIRISDGVRQTNRKSVKN